MMARLIFMFLVMLCVGVERVSAEERIVFSQLSEDGFWQIGQIQPDGTNPKIITTSKEDKREPAWLSDGRIIFRTNNGQAYILSQDGTSQEEILSDYPRINTPQFSNDRHFIVFTRFDPRFKDIRDIWKTDADGQNAGILTREHKFTFQPSISDDGQSIVFVKADEKREYHHIWIMDVNTEHAVELTDTKAQDILPRFSPDKQWVVFSSNRYDDNFEIYLVNVKDKKTKRLTNNPGLDSYPCFSPDGKRIAFISDRGGHKQIWVMNNDGSNLVVLSAILGESIEPDWANIN